ncbi:MAG: histidine--tRNA ligase [Bacilli bacterium]|nr:histidine--tRNA ligase [Bacilli bacterium]
MKINKLKGVLDYYGEDAKRFQIVRNVSTEICEAYGYSEVITPIIEQSDVFIRSAGEQSDIVGKEMYIFKDRGDREIALKPESTASVMRMVVENKLYVNPGVKKYYYCSPNFRYERPQAGRFRQFYQFGVETMCEESPYLDAEVIEMAYRIVKKLGISKVCVYINTLGSDESRKVYTKELKSYFEGYLNELCPDCQRRFEKNPLRMLDCKVDANTTIMKNAPKIGDYLQEEDNEYFNKLCAALDALNVPYVINPRLVRGLDYYTNDIFEIIYEEENSPYNGLALIAGGRYNNLGQEFDGPQIPSIGFGMGVERMMGVISELDTYKDNEKCKVAVLTLSETCKVEGLLLANYLRENGFLSFLDYKNNNLKPQFKLCDRENVDYILIIGDDEVSNNVIRAKNVKTNEQIDLPIEKLNEYFGIKKEKAYAYKH